MKKVKQHLKAIVGALIYIFLNYFVTNIPCWHIRKLIYMLFGMKIGTKSRLNMKVIVWDPWKVKIGKGTIVNEYAFLDGRGGLTIGDGTSIAMWAVLYSSSHYADSDSFEYYTKTTSIGNSCWICARTVVLPGSNVADRAIIGANSVFKGEAKTAGIYGGNPCQYIRERNVDENYEREWVTHLR